MAKRVSINTLNASTLDILNTIRQNASYEYQSQIPEITDVHDIPRVGEILYGYPALANQFLNMLVNRIALVKIKSAVFNNAYAKFKKGYLEFGETVEEVFVSIAKAREFSAEKAASRELKRTIPDVRTAFHAMNWRVQYPVTIQDEDLRMAFQSADGIRDLIARIVDSVYTGAEYDEYLLFKYLLIKAISHGKVYPIGINARDAKASAKAFRGASNLLTFMNTKYNMEGVHTTTPREDQNIFMDSMFNAEFDVDVLSAAFNMDKATFLGNLTLIDDWTTFDNDRFNEIRANCDMIEEVTPAELALMKNVKAVIADTEWFQVYDNQIKMTEQYVASGEYWNYFLNIWKTVSSSPFSNAVVFIDTSADNTPIEFTAEVVDKSVSDIATVITLDVNTGNGLGDRRVQFVQNDDCVTKGVAVHPYGAYMFPANADAVKVLARIDDNYYESTTNLATTAAVGDTITLTISNAIVISADKANPLELTTSSDRTTITFSSNVPKAKFTITCDQTQEGDIVINDTAKTIEFNPPNLGGSYNVTVVAKADGYIEGKLIYTVNIAT